MKCPSCATMLERRDLSEQGFITVGRCPSCRGCWLDKAELDSAHEGVWENFEQIGVTASETLSGYLCPHCAARMMGVNPDDHPELQVDRCPSCHGIWLDNGEIEKLREVVLEYAEQHRTLHERPEGWSAMRWMLYRLAVQVNQPPTD